MGRIAMQEAAAVSAPELGSAQALKPVRHAQVRILGVAAGADGGLRTAVLPDSGGGAGDARVATTGVDLCRAHVP